VVREYTYLGAEDGILQLRVDRRTSGPYGIDGGQSGTPLSATINPGSDTELDIGKTTMPLGTGDRLRIQVAGAGGWGAPCERDPVAVMADVRNGFISVERAREVYLVVLDETGQGVDKSETASLRSNNKQGV
jgi:N-methylhydantoinase B/oxoprolinase/acetone carboxylase alpha subunit